MWLAAVYTYKPSTNNQYLYSYLPMLHVALLPTSIFFAMATYDALITKYFAIYSKSSITAASITEILPNTQIFLWLNSITVISMWKMTVIVVVNK